MDEISGSCGWDKEIPHGVLHMEQLVLTDKWARKLYSNIRLGRYIVGYTVGNLVLQRCASVAVKRDFQPYIQRYNCTNENFKYGYPHSNALLEYRLKSA